MGHLVNIPLIHQVRDTVKQSQAGIPILIEYLGGDEPDYKVKFLQ